MLGVLWEEEARKIATEQNKTNDSECGSCGREAEGRRRRGWSAGEADKKSVERWRGGGACGEWRGEGEER